MFLIIFNFYNCASRGMIINAKKVNALKLEIHVQQLEENNMFAFNKSINNSKEKMNIISK